MKDLLKSLLHRLLAEYSIYWIYRCQQQDLITESSGLPPVFELPEEDSQTLPAGAMRDQAGFLGTEAKAYTFREGDQVTAICIFWYGQRYATRNFWPLKPGDAKLVQVITDPAARGKGAATALIRQSSEKMLNDGFERLFARIWHSNTPSLKAFERAGWKRIYLAIELKRTADSMGVKFFIPTWASLKGSLTGRR